MRNIGLLIVILYFALFLSGLFFVPIVYVMRTGKFWKGVMLTWILWLVLSWIHVFMYPFLIQLSILIYDEYPGTGGEAFFGAILMFVLGWIPGLFISGFAMLLRNIFALFSTLLFRNSKEIKLDADKENDAIELEGLP